MTNHQTNHQTTTETPARYLRTCSECGRVFDMLDPDDAVEFTYGHDCEA